MVMENQLLLKGYRQPGYYRSAMTTHTKNLQVVKEKIEVD